MVQRRSASSYEGVAVDFNKALADFARKNGPETDLSFADTIPKTSVASENLFLCLQAQGTDTLRLEAFLTMCYILFGWGGVPISEPWLYEWMGQYLWLFNKCFLNAPTEVDFNILVNRMIDWVRLIVKHDLQYVARRI